MKITLPAVFGANESLDGNRLSHLLVSAWRGDATVASCTTGKSKGYKITLADTREEILLLTNGARPPDDVPRVIRKLGLVLDCTGAEADCSEARWERHPSLRPAPSTVADFEHIVAQVIGSWAGALAYKKESPETGQPGLRPPQLGAIYAAQSHFTVYREPGTIVMPTGTGKTETMLGILVAEQCPRLLVVVPTDPLRTQIADKFGCLGVLKASGVVADDASYPVVGVLKHAFKAPAHLALFLRKCNVVVATMPLVTGWTDAQQTELASHFTHLFIDEAHHMGAPKWEAFRNAFHKSRILQFTATPYRNDEKPVGGRIIFNYPLGQAQDDGYFKPITFKPVVEFDPRKRDRAIALAAIEQLRADLDKGHILMARVSGITRATEVFEIYNEFPEFNPVQIHTGITSTQQRKEIHAKIITRQARIVVCVDMLGEGFDLPELKIAAFHDIRHSLPITLQLAGRFTRSRPDLGNATFVANIADIHVKDELRRLYQRDVDWNKLLPQYSDKAIADEFDLWSFLGGFKKFPHELSLQNVRPAMSAVAYSTKCKEWNPENFAQGIPGHRELDRVYSDTNPQEDTLVILTTKRVALDWARIDDIYSWDWQLYVLLWDRERQLLFIHNSSNSGFFKDLASAVCGSDVRRVEGPEIFRCLAAVTRLRLNNVGLLEPLGRFIRYTMRAGSDVESGLSETQKQKAIKSNLFGTGFENGHRTSIGCSYKGRMWSHQTTNLKELKRWCQGVGARLIDQSLDPDKVLEGTLRPQYVAARPAVMPIGVDWPDGVYRTLHQVLKVSFPGGEAYWHELDISLDQPSESGELCVIVQASSGRVRLALELFTKNDANDFRFRLKDGLATLTVGSESDSIDRMFSEDPPTIWFADGSSLRGNELVQLRRGLDPYPRERIDPWDWAGTDIKKESQGIDKHADSIQFRVLQALRKRPWSVLFDDDDAGEAADIVGIIEKESSVDVEFYHCKYSGAATAGARIGDLYELCGQAQKSVRWMEEPSSVFTHLLRREPRQSAGRSGTRFEIGTMDDLLRIREKSLRSRVNLCIYLVQPGLSKSQASTSQLELLAVVDNYLKETFMVPCHVVGSP